MRVAVIGGGINGYSCAVQILEFFKNFTNETIEVTVLSDEFSPNTTGDGSAGLWGPYLLGETSQSKIYKWSKAMHDFLEKIWLSEDAGKAGICLLPVIRTKTGTEPLKEYWKDIVYGFMHLSPEQLKEYNTIGKKEFKNGAHFITYTSEPLKLLPYLMKRFQLNGGRTIQMKVENLNQFIDSSDFDVYINCCGLGSRNLVKDRAAYPVRGQVARFKAPWMNYAFLDDSDESNYIIPNTESVVLGGTHQKNDYNTDVCTIDRKFILEGCRKLVPGLENALHLYDWVGLRPGRDNLRLQTEKYGNKLIIHNYGHGGAGVTLSWGCAQDVLEMLKKELLQKENLKSKL